MQSCGFFIFLVLGVWLLIASIILFRILVFFNKLSRGLEVTDLKKVLNKIFAQDVESVKNIASLGKRMSYLEEDAKLHVQKIGLVRFNPFRELGGDHSFSLAVLDAEDSGIIITSLHTRDRTRVYMKDIKKGRSSFELSTEERKALNSAQKGK
jgi:hypothetical protein